jgi:hypothetical protein
MRRMIQEIHSKKKKDWNTTDNFIDYAVVNA